MPPRILPLVLFTCAFIGDASGAQPVQLKPAHITFHLDAAGKPSGFACMADLPATTCATITAAASRWSYLPGMSGGKPVAMRTWMTLNLQAVPKSGGFALKAGRVSVREAGKAADDVVASQTLYVPPQYPKDAMRRGEKGLVVLELWFEPGSDRLSVRNAWLDGKKPRKRSQLVAAATAAVAAWNVGPYSPNVFSICVPVAFQLDRSVPSLDTEPCRPSYAAGYRSPELLTQPAQMVF